SQNRMTVLFGGCANMLTDAALKALKPKDKVYKVSDRDGMYARVTPTGLISFSLDYRLNGRRETSISAGTDVTAFRSHGLANSAWTPNAQSERAAHPQLKNSARSAA